MSSREPAHPFARAAGALALLAAALLATGCGSDETRAAGGEDGGSTATESPEPPETSVAVPEPTATVEPATGPWLATKYARVRMPEGWRQVNDVGFGSIAQADGPGGRGTMHFSVYPAEGLTSLDQAARFTIKDIRDRLGSGSLRRVDDVVMGGNTMAFHLTGHQLFWDVDAYGVLRNGARFVVIFSLNELKPPEENRALAESVIQTWEFTLAQ